MEYRDIIGTIAAFCTTISFLPQVIKAYRTKRAKDLSLPMYMVFLIGVAAWFYYGIITASLPIIVANVVTFGLASAIVAMKIKYR